MNKLFFMITGSTEFYVHLLTERGGPYVDGIYHSREQLYEMLAERYTGYDRKEVAESEYKKLVHGWCTGKD